MQQLKASYLAHVAALHEARARDLGTVLADAVHDDVLWHGPHPIDELRGRDALEHEFWSPLLHAFPDLERREGILLAGAYDAREWIGATGFYAGTFARDWLGIPASGGLAYLRFGEFHAIDAGGIRESYLLLDLVDLMRQAGIWLLPPSRGAEGAWDGPMTHDGVLLEPQDEAEGRRTIELARAMGDGLRAYDGKTLESMGQERFWHRRMMWYGPAGIGSTRGLEGFQDFHQVPFLEAFPDRVGGDHRASFGEGHYAGWVGWPSVRATHAGGGWLGLEPSGRSVGMRVMDFYRREGDLLRENWVFIDIPDLLGQMGVDLFAHHLPVRPLRAAES